MVVYLLPCLLCFSSFRVSESFKTEESTFTIPTTMAARLHNPSPSSSSASPPLVSSASRPHQSFIRPILPVVLQAKKMILPQKFVGLYGSELSSTAELSLPNGAVWTVGVEKGSNREVNFGENWVEFVKLYSISVGFFLRFDYRGDSKFAVQIYDLSCCGIAGAGDGEDGSVEHFWRLIVPSVVREKQLRLPIKFATKHGKKLAMRKYSNAELHLPNGTVCQAGITAGKDRKELWFKRGWSKFMEDNSVKEKFLLTFEYAGGSRFNVTIFDRSTTAILHPPPQPQSPPPPPPPPQVVVYDECKNLMDGLDAKGIAMAGKFRAHTFPAMSPGSKRAMREAIRSKRDDDVVPSFVVVMKPQRPRARKTYRCIIPHEIVDKLEMKDGDLMNLQAMGGVSGGFEVELKNCGVSLSIRGDGWTTFYSANGLKEGDVCLFRVGNGLETEVSIFRA
ncbi:B3 domain-containing transcription factor VRN1 [Linum grandiflorum]